VPVKGHCQQDGHQDIDKMAVTGRVSVQQQGPEEWIVLHGRDAKAYLLTGYLRDRLREMALKNQQHNYLTGVLTGEHTVSCKHTSNFGVKESDQKIRR